MTDDDITIPIAEAARYPYRVIVLTMHRKRGPVEVIVLCETQDEAVSATRLARNQQTNQRANAIVRLDVRKSEGWKPLVQWTYAGAWRREIQ